MAELKQYSVLDESGCKCVDHLKHLMVWHLLMVWQWRNRRALWPTGPVETVAFLICIFFSITTRDQRLIRTWMVWRQLCYQLKGLIETWILKMDQNFNVSNYQSSSPQRRSRAQHSNNCTLTRRANHRLRLSHVRGRACWFELHTLWHKVCSSKAYACLTFRVSVQHKYSISLFLDDQHCPPGLNVVSISLSAVIFKALIRPYQNCITQISKGWSASKLKK